MKKRGMFWGMVIVVCFALLAVAMMVRAGEKEELKQEWRAIVAEYNLALARWQQSSPEFKDLNEFAAKLDQKGFMFERDAKGGLVYEKDGKGNLVIKITEKPKPEKKPEPEKKVEPEKKP